jgi:hypothetical protein
MNCCNEYDGTCTQGRDCPIRKQRTKETDEAYVKGFLIGQEAPLDDIADTFKALIAVIAVTASITLLAFWVWGK